MKHAKPTNKDLLKKAGIISFTLIFLNALGLALINTSNARLGFGVLAVSLFWLNFVVLGFALLAYDNFSKKTGYKLYWIDDGFFALFGSILLTTMGSLIGGFTTLGAITGFITGLILLTVLGFIALELGQWLYKRLDTK